MNLFYLLIQKILRFLAVFFVLATTLSSICSAESSIRIPEARSKYDISHDYHKELLLMALNKAADGREVPHIQTTIQMSQGRAMNELLKGEVIDVYWFGASQIIDKNLIAIKVPTSRGLIGFRKFTIHKNSVPVFDNVKSINDLQKLIACQGTHWPDTDILTMAELTVATTTDYENLFKMLYAGRCDYFPRGLHDAKTELALRKHLYPDLISYNNIILHYPFAIYFFTKKSNTALVTWLENGLNQLAKDGDIERLMKRHPLTSSVYPLQKEKNSVYIDIPNHLLTPNTDIKNADYWIQLEDFTTTIETPQ